MDAHALLNQISPCHLTGDHALLSGRYLNASYISTLPNLDTGLNFIASQAPLPHTFPRFYEAIAEQKIALLVNLTRLREGGREKAHQYWPASSQIGEAVDVGEGCKVTLLSEEEVPAPVGASQVAEGPEWQLTKRKLQIQSDSIPKPHTFIQLHFLSWPDHSTSSAGDYEHLLRYILSETRPTSSVRLNDAPPLWLHCSAGVGRTGTAIAGLMAIELRESGLLGPENRSQDEASALTINLIAHLRNARPAMVQGPKQAQMIVALVQLLAAESNKQSN